MGERDQRDIYSSESLEGTSHVTSGAELGRDNLLGRVAGRLGRTAAGL